MWVVLLLLLLLLSLPSSVNVEDLGELSANPYNPDSTSNPFSPYGSPFSNQSTTNPYATDAPRLYDQQGNCRGKLSANPYDPDSTSNPYGRYGSPFLPDSINNPFGAGNPYSPAVPRIPTATASELKDADPAAEPLQVNSRLLDTSPWTA